MSTQFLSTPFSFDFLRKQEEDGSLGGVDRYRLLVVGVILGPFLGVLIALGQLALIKGSLLGGALEVFTNLALLIGFYVPIAFGVTGGLHRLFTHNSYKATRPTTIVIGLLANSAIEGTITSWCADHREHHQFSDTKKDLHSPMKDFWYAHIGWFFDRRDRDLQKYVPDLLRDPTIQLLDRVFPLCVVASFVVPTLLAGAIGALSGDFLGAAWKGFIWGGLVRIFFVHHVTWSINSLFHIWGKQYFKTPTNDWSRDAPMVLIGKILRVLGFGEPGHNAHHAFPWSAVHAFVPEMLEGKEPPAWMDITYVIERWMERRGWVIKGSLKVPTPEQYCRMLLIPEQELQAAFK